MEWNLWTTGLFLPPLGCHLPGRDCGGPGADVCNLGIQRVLSKITMRLWVTGGLCLCLKSFGLRRSTEHAQNPCLAPSKETRTLRTLKSGAKRREEGGQLAAVSAAFGGQSCLGIKLSSGLWRCSGSKGRCGEQRSLLFMGRVCLSLFLLVMVGRGRFPRHGSDLSFERLRSLSQKLRVADDWEAVCEGPRHPGGDRGSSQSPEEAEEVWAAGPSGTAHQEGPLLCSRAGCT